MGTRDLGIEDFSEVSHSVNVTAVTKPKTLEFVK